MRFHLTWGAVTSSSTHNRARSGVRILLYDLPPGWVLGGPRNRFWGKIVEDTERNSSTTRSRDLVGRLYRKITITSIRTTPREEFRGAYPHRHGTGGSSPRTGNTEDTDRTSTPQLIFPSWGCV